MVIRCRKLGYVAFFSVYHVLILETNDYILEVHEHFYHNNFFLVIFAIYGAAVKHALNSISELYLIQFYRLVYSVGLESNLNCEQKSSRIHVTICLMFLPSAMVTKVRCSSFYSGHWPSIAVSA